MGDEMQLLPIGSEVSGNAIQGRSAFGRPRRMAARCVIKARSASAAVWKQNVRHHHAWSADHVAQL